MRDTLGERKQRWARRKKQFAILIIVLVVAGGGAGYVFTLDPNETTKPMDIVQGTGAYLKDFEMAFIGPPELKVRWDRVDGQAWSIAWISGWVRNESAKTVEFEGIAYRLKDKENDILWEETDDRFINGFELGPAEYIAFDVMPICKRPAKRFEVEILGARTTRN